MLNISSGSLTNPGQYYQGVGGYPPTLDELQRFQGGLLDQGSALNSAVFSGVVPQIISDENLFKIFGVIVGLILLLVSSYALVLGQINPVLKGLQSGIKK